ncbi:FkbM family methyltransferase [Gluconacetobacter diazotrophicus]|nr:FkbM family methyltransferase [Gluconacetobacter diazotrophicus]
MFLEEFYGLINERIASLDALRGKKIPIVMYGAGEYASTVEKFLAKENIYIADRFVDETYEKRLGVLHFDDIKEKYAEFFVVLGMADIKRGMEAVISLNCKDIVSVHYFFLSPHYLDEINSEFILNNAQKFSSIFEILDDDLSKETFVSYIKSQITGSDSFVRNVCRSGQYFQDFIKIDRNEVFVDAGAYTGDTLRDFLKFSNGIYQKYYAFEPNSMNFQKLKLLIEQEKIPNVHAMNCGLGKRREAVKFHQENNTSTVSKISVDGNVDIQIDTIDHLCPDATFIKMDIEGGEVDALLGGMKTINKNKPKLAICVYHNPLHLWEVALYVKKWFQIIVYSFDNIRYSAQSWFCTRTLPLLSKFFLGLSGRGNLLLLCE